MAKSNAQLTEELNNLARTVEGIRDKLNTVIQNVRDNILESGSATNAIQEGLRALVNPILEANVVGKQTQIDSNITVIDDAFKKMQGEMSTQMNQMQAIMLKMDNFDPVEAVVGNVEAQVKKLETDTLKRLTETTEVKSESSKEVCGGTVATRDCVERAGIGPRNDHWRKGQRTLHHAQAAHRQGQDHRRRGIHHH